MQSVNFPNRDEAVWKKTGVETVFLLLSVLVVPYFLALGYLQRVLEGSLRDEPRLPEWKDYGHMLVSGLVSFAVWFVYLLPFALLYSVKVLLTSHRSSSLFAPETILSNFLLFGSLMLMVVGLSVVPIALARDAHQQKWQAAFQVSSILADVRAAVTDYSPVVMGFVVFAFGLGFFGNFVSGLPLYLGYAISMGIAFYGGVVLMHWTGSVYIENFGEEAGVETEAPAPTGLGPPPPPANIPPTPRIPEGPELVLEDLELPSSESD